MLKAKKNCPFSAFAPCVEFDCGFYTGLRGTDPNTGQDVDEYGCAVAWLPVLLIENAQQARQCGAAVESFRNVMVEQNNEMAAAMLTAQQKAIAA